VLDVVAELCTQDAAQSAERSCAERASSARLQQAALPDAEHLVPPGRRKVALKQ